MSEIEVTYDRNTGYYQLTLSGSEDLITLRYALDKGVERLESAAIFFEAHPDYAEHAIDARETADRARSLSDHIEAAVKRMVH